MDLGLDTARAGSSVEERRSYKPRVAGSIPVPPTHRAASSVVEHCLDAAGVAGSNPARPTRRSGRVDYDTRLDR